MSKHFTRELVAEQAAIVAAPKTMPETDRSFELPKGLYIATVGLYLGFLAVMAAGLSTPGLIIPMVIFTLFIVAGFGLPALWTRIGPEHRGRNMSWAKLVSQGIVTHTGRVKAGDAAVQMLILPALIFCWGIATVTITAFV